MQNILTKTLFLIALTYSCILPSNSQIIKEEIHITTTEHATIYSRSKNEPRIDELSKRTIVTLNNRNTKRIKSPTKVKVIGLTNQKAQLQYDTYEIEYKGNRYLMPKEFSNSNSYIDSINQSLQHKHDSLLQRRDSLKLLFENSIENHKNTYNEKIKNFESLIALLPTTIKNKEEEAIANYETLKEKEFDEIYNLWYKRQPASTKAAIKAITITEAELSSPNSAGGCDYRFYYINNSKKSIKYLHWDGWVYNAVNDIVSCEIRGSGYVGGKDTGPITQGESGGGWWECVIYNYSAESVKLSSIDIQYMDNSRITIGENDIRRMLNAPKKEYIPWQKTDSIKKAASKQYKKRLKECNDSLSIYKNLYHKIQEMQFDTEETIQLQQLQSQIKETTNKIEIFCIDNLLNSEYNSTIIAKTTREAIKYEQDKKTNKKVAFGTGTDIFFSGRGYGITLPVEIIFGNINQYVNFSISGEYSFIGSYENMYINRLGAYANLHINFGQNGYFRYPLSIGVGYNGNFGNSVYLVSGTYYTEDYRSMKFSYPIVMNKLT